MIWRRESEVALLQVGMEFPPTTEIDRPTILCAFSQPGVSIGHVSHGKTQLHFDFVHFYNKVFSTRQSPDEGAPTGLRAR